MDRQSFIQAYAADAANTLASLASHGTTLEKIGDALVTALKAGNKILAAGNGGSACEAMHLCEELTGKYNKPRRALPGLCLAVDASALTCIANDWDFASIFTRQIEAFAKPGDVLVLFTTSGNSENLLRAADLAKRMGVTTVALSGRTGGKLKGKCDLELIVESPAPHSRGSHVQEAHQAILHLLLEHIDSVFVP